LDKDRKSSGKYITFITTNTVQTYLKYFPNWRFLGRLPGVPSTRESF